MTIPYRSMIERTFMQELRDTAMGMCTGNLNPDWVRAYEALADAADRLDAMQARLELQPPGGWCTAEPYNATDALLRAVDAQHPASGPNMTRQKLCHHRCQRCKERFTHVQDVHTPCTAPTLCEPCQADRRRSANVAKERR